MPKKLAEWKISMEKKLKKRAQILIISYSILLVLICIALFTSLTKKPSSYVENTNSVAQSVTKYVVKEYGNKIAVFMYGEVTPFKVHDVYVSTLPEADQIELKKGINVSTIEELRKLIEDYTS